MIYSLECCRHKQHGSSRSDEAAGTSWRCLPDEIIVFVRDSEDGIDSSRFQCLTLLPSAELQNFKVATDMYEYPTQTGRTPVNVASTPSPRRTGPYKFLSESVPARSSQEFRSSMNCDRQKTGFGVQNTLPADATAHHVNFRRRDATLSFCNSALDTGVIQCRSWIVDGVYTDVEPFTALFHRIVVVAKPSLS